MNFSTALATRINRSRIFKDNLKLKRKKMIKEALGWTKGELVNPHKHKIITLPNGMDVYFLKPGKEVNNIKRPNPHDMTPIVGNTSYKLRFDEVWTALARASLIDFECFKAILVLIYRNAYLIDHIETSPGKIRYQPSQKICDTMTSIEEKVGKISPFGLLGLMHFLNVLGWNEDVKYHVEDNHPTFSGKYKFKVGRINTFLTCIRVPYQAAWFVNNSMDSYNRNKEIDFMELFTIMQQFAKSRGTCTPTQKQLLEWLSPFIRQ